MAFRGKKKAILEAAQTPGVERTITAICKEAGCSRESFYRWYAKDEEFKDAWNTIWELQIDRYMPGIVSAQVDKALSGNTRAAKLVSELGSKLRPELKTEVEGKLEVVVRYVDADD